MAADIEAERTRIREILASPGAQMNPNLAEYLAYDSNLTASVAIGILESGPFRRNPLARELILAARHHRANS